MSSAADCAPASGRGHLTLVPGLRRLWRDEHAVQLGVDPARAIVVELPDPRTARVLDLLDGSRTEQGVLRDAVGLGVPRDVAGALVGALRAANVVVVTDTLLPSSLPEPARQRLVSEAASIAMRRRSLERPSEPVTPSTAAPVPGRPARARVPAAAPAEVLRRRAATSVQVTGASRLVVPICSALATAGIGHVDPALVGRVRPTDCAIGGLLPADADRPRGTAATEAVMRAAPHADTRSLRDGAAGFVVQVGQGVPAELAAFGYARRALPHLLIEERDESILVGPLVTAGGSPCLRCLDLHRRDRDPAWPALVAQLATAGDEATTASTATTIVAVGVAVAQILGYLDGLDVVTIGASIEVGPPIHLRRRSWAAHPRCDCAHRPRSPRRFRPG
ncbi:MAG TPA: hypothetical protein VKB69_14550 [Micromonosporaceae bacterium]|nr:hypothetical protein [Micromonosporaceae bacterium]